MYAMRQAVLSGKTQAFAKGGAVWPLAGSSWSTYPGHDGIDLNAPNDYGKPIRAFRSGTISYVGWNHGYGDAVFEAGPWGTVVYGHMSRTAVKAGQRVSAGQILGNVGSTGHSTGPHLHFGFPGGTPSQALALLAGATSIKGGGSIGASPQESAKAKWSDALTSVPGLAKKTWDSIRAMSSTGFGGEMKKAATAMLRHGAGFIDDKIPNRFLPDNPVSDVLHKIGVFDNGGVLEPGAFAYNASKRPEAVYNHKQFKQFAEAQSGNNRPARFDLHLDRNSKIALHGYVSEIAGDTYNGETAFAGTTRRMGGR